MRHWKLRTEVPTMKGKFKSSCKIPCADGLLDLSSDGQLFTTKSNDCVFISSCSTLQKVASLPITGPITILKFSPDSKRIVWLSMSPLSVNVYEIGSQDRLEIGVDPGLAVISLICGSKCLLYVSELEVFIGVYDFEKHKSFTLEGCSLDDFNRPLLTFSPNGDYLSYVSGHRLLVYSTENWTLKSAFNCPISPLLPVFINPYTIFMNNHEGVIEWFSVFGSKIKTDSVLPSKCIVGTELSNDGRTLFACTYDNKVVSFDTISMERQMEFEYLYCVNAKLDVRTFVGTDEIVQDDKVKLQKFKEIKETSVRELKNIMDEFKRKVQVKHFTSLNHDDTLLATFNPASLHSVWVWNFSKKHRLDSVISLKESAGKVKGLRWHRYSNRLAVCCSNMVVIWTEGADLIAFPGEHMNFKWLNIKASVGVLVSENYCRFVYFR